MLLDVTHIWTGIGENLRLLVSKEIFNLWFAHISPLGAGEGVLTLGVRDEFSQIWLEDNYASLLRDLAAKNSPEISNVRFVIIPKNSESPAPATPVPAPTIPTSDFPVRKRPSTAKFTPTFFNPKNSFESFVVGGNNQFAHAAALAVTQAPGHAYNPFFIHGGTGLGKTHLIQAIGSSLAQSPKRMQVVYIPCETFINDFVDAIQNKSVIAFRRKYRNADALLIDDVHFLSGKEGLQEEFFHTFNALFENRKQIVLSSDRPIGEITNLEKRLVSRFEWGLVTEVSAPDYETRLAILRKKLAMLNVTVGHEILEFMAHRVKSNIRRLEGALVRVASYASLSGKPLDLETATHLLRDTLKQEGGKTLNIEAIQKLVAQHFDIRLADMTSKRRPQSVAFPRQVAMFLSRRLTKASLAEIGEKFGNRDHGTVMHACQLIEKKMQTDTTLLRAVEFLDQQLQQ